MNECLKIRLGIRSLVPRKLPSYPYQISRESAAWPVDASTQNKLTRFDWKQTIDHTTNQVAFKEVLEHIKSNGPTLFPAAAESLSRILDGDLTERVRTRVKYLIKEAKKSQTARESSIDGDLDNEDGASEGEEGKHAMAHAQSVSIVHWSHIHVIIINKRLTENGTT